MKKKLFAMLTAVLCCTGLTAFPVSAETPVTNAELEALIETKNTLWDEFISAGGYVDTSAYARLKWNSHEVELLCRTQEVYDAAAAYLAVHPADAVTLVLAPDYEYERKCGGANESGEVNGIVAAEYFGLKAYLTEQAILSNIYLTYTPDAAYPDLYVDGIEVQVKHVGDAAALAAYMDENYYWQDVVTVTVAPELTAPPAGTVRNKAYVCTAGDTNDDGAFGVTDVIKLQKYLLHLDTLHERGASACDLTGDGRVDVFDLALEKQMLIQSQ